MKHLHIYLMIYGLKQIPIEDINSDSNDRHSL